MVMRSVLSRGHRFELRLPTTSEFESIGYVDYYFDTNRWELGLTVRRLGGDRYGVSNLVLGDYWKDFRDSAGLQGAEQFWAAVSIARQQAIRYLTAPEL